MSQIAKLVRLYRFIANPQINLNFTCRNENIELSNELIETAEDIWTDPRFPLSTVEIRVGKTTYTKADDLETLRKFTNGTICLVIITIPRTGNAQFYLSPDDFVTRSRNLDNGDFPVEFYLVDKDYLHGGTPSHLKPSEVTKMEHFCEFIRLLKQTSHFIDSESHKVSKAVFVITDENSKESSPKTVSLEFSQKLLSLDELDLSVLRDIVEPKIVTHRQENLSIFRVALWEVLSHAAIADSEIYFIAVHWEELIKTFKSNHELYIRGFSFSKFTGEVHDYVHDNIAKAHNLLSEISLKVLTIPSLFLVWLYVLRIKTFDETFSIALSATLTLSAIVIILVVDNQHYFVRQLMKSTRNTFNRFTLKSNLSSEFIDEDRQEIINMISTNKDELLGRLKFIKHKLVVIRFMIWLFVLIAFYTTVHVNWVYSFPVNDVHVIFSIFIAVLLSIQCVLSNKKEKHEAS
jgi:hypothetical protein